MYLRSVFIIFCCFPFLLSAQSSFFKINGTINIDTGKVAIQLISNKAYYPDDLTTNIKTTIVNGKFTFEGKIDAPIGVEFLYGNNFASKLFVIYPGVQTLILDANADNATPNTDNYGLIEQNFFKKESRSIEKKWIEYEKISDSLSHYFKGKIPNDFSLKLQKERNKNYKSGDSVLLAFVISHPNSYFAFWKLIGLNVFGYTPIIDSIYSNFSDHIKATKNGKLLYNDIKIGRLTSIDTPFPKLNVTDINGIGLNKKFHTKNKYTLVEFWFSHCIPCISQFNILKQIRNNYNNKGFEIIGVSTDKSEYIKNWKAILKKHALPWPQFLDINGVQAHKLNIHLYPTNFLLNDKGIIIAKNLSPIELEYFLKESLNQN